MKKGNKSKVQEENNKLLQDEGFYLDQPEIHKKKERENLGN